MINHTANSMSGQPTRQSYSHLRPLGRAGLKSVIKAVACGSLFILLMLALASGSSRSALAQSGGPIFAFPIPLGSSARTYSVATGDLNGDGALDLVLGNADQPRQGYLND